jgi:hypothetical protein
MTRPRTPPARPFHGFTPEALRVQSAQRNAMHDALLARLAAEMARRGVSPYVAARQLLVNPASLRRWFVEPAALPALDVAARVAAWCGVTLDELVGRPSEKVICGGR